MINREKKNETDEKEKYILHCNDYADAYIQYKGKLDRRQRNYYGKISRVFLRHPDQ